MGNSTAMDRLKQTQSDLATTPAGQALLEQGATVRQMRLDNYLTAVSVQKPRDKMMVIKEVEFEAELLGEKAYYSWTAGGSMIEGPSVDLAMVMIREWGNCAARADLVAETGTHFLFDGIFMDLEKGITVIRQFRQVKENRGKGKMDAERAEDIVFQIGQSKGLRNAICAAMPAWLISKALKKAKQSAAKSMTSEKVVEAFNKWGVDQKTLERKLGKACKRWDEMEMAVLRGIYQSLLDGMTTIDNEFGDDQAAATVAEAAKAAAPAPKAKENPTEKTAPAEQKPAPTAENTAAPAEKVDPETGEVTTEPSTEPAPAPDPEAGGEGTPAAKKAIEAFAKLNVTQAQLEAKMEKPAGEWKRGELNKLKAMIKSINDGDVASEALFPATAAPSSEDDDGGSWE